MKATQVFYEGRVQGVGFRYSVRKSALGFEVQGWVRNLPDGRVELQVSGDASEVRDFLQDLRESGIAGHVTNEHIHTIEIATPFKGFQIVP